MFEKNDNGGSFYRKYPIHRKLISINKRATTRGHSPIFNERHDWNSLLSSNKSLLVGKYSKDFYPHADAYVQYLEDYSDYLIQISPKGSMHFSTEVVHVSRTEGTDDHLDVRTRNLSTEEEMTTTCRHLIWATGLQPKGLDFLVKGKELKGVEFYSDVDGTSERYFNESIALVGAGNSGMETATALQNSVGFIALMSDFQFSWRSHYVGDVRSVNANFIDGYLLKSLDYINAGSRVNAIIRNTHGKLMLKMIDPASVKKKDATNGTDSASGNIVSTPMGERVESEEEKCPTGQCQQSQQQGRGEDPAMSGKMDAYSLEEPSNACETSMEECQIRVGAESGRSSILGFDRVIFCTGFRFKLADPPIVKTTVNKEGKYVVEQDAKPALFAVNVRPALDRTRKYPKQNYDYSSANVKGLHFAGALTHERDYKRGAGGFIHGFRYTARALTRKLNHLLPKDAPGSTPWPSVDLTRQEFASGDHMLTRINEMAGPYQMFSELCDLIVFEADEKHCKEQKKRKTKRKLNNRGNDYEDQEENDRVFAKYYEEVPVSFMPELVSQHLKKSKYMSVCFDYGHGKFSEMDTLHHKYIGTRFGPIAEAIGMPHLMDQQADPSQQGDPFAGSKGTGVKRPSKRMGPTGAGVDSNFLHPVISLFDLDDEEQIETVEKIAQVM